MFREEGQPKANRALAALLAMNRRRRYPSLSFIVPCAFPSGRTVPTAADTRSGNVRKMFF
ncbi:hypothetical protein DQG23_40955 [Paenibacillus contaminans]|uniref:Uncharacterized protein n=1 Tax=Paenibacillus contaminans TaxID=450362 RepID=A0A329LL55_9BACL|nr:hypothetical protein DQG23_40955 [Paenibacillus contaminans]